MENHNAKTEYILRAFTWSKVRALRILNQRFDHPTARHFIKGFMDVIQGEAMRDEVR